LILGGGFSEAKLSGEDTAEIECLTDVAVATNFRTEIAITGFVAGGSVDSPQNADIVDTLQQLREVVMATTFRLPIGY